MTKNPIFCAIDTVDVEAARAQHPFDLRGHGTVVVVADREDDWRLYQSARRGPANPVRLPVSANAVCYRGARQRRG